MTLSLASRNANDSRNEQVFLSGPPVTLHATSTRCFDFQHTLQCHSPVLLHQPHASHNEFKDEREHTHIEQAESLARPRGDKITPMPDTTDKASFAHENRLILARAAELHRLSWSQKLEENWFRRAVKSTNLGATAHLKLLFGVS